MHMVNDQTPKPDQGHNKLVIPADDHDPAYVEGRYYEFTLCWNGADGIAYSTLMRHETQEGARLEAVDILKDHPGHTEAVLGDQNGDDVPLEPLPPILHLINFKTRRASVLRGENALADALSRGFKVVTPAHFVKYVDNARKGFRTKGKRK